MRTIEEVRRARLAMLVEEFGSYAALNRLRNKLERDSTLSQIAGESANSKGGKPKAMGSPIARDLERVCKKETGWMDNDPDQFWPFTFPPKTWRTLTEREVGVIEGLVVAEMRRIRGGSGELDSSLDLPPPRKAA